MGRWDLISEGVADLITPPCKNRTAMINGFDTMALMKQHLCFEQSEYAVKKMVTRRGRFLGDMLQMAASRSSSNSACAS